MRLGFEAKSAAKMLNIQKQRQFVTQQRQESEFKLKRAQQKNEIVLNDVAFDKVDEERSLHKLISASALYDKNSPGDKAIPKLHSLQFTNEHVLYNRMRRFGCLRFCVLDSGHVQGSREADFQCCVQR